MNETMNDGLGRKMVELMRNTGGVERLLEGIDEDSLWRTVEHVVEQACAVAMRPAPQGMRTHYGPMIPNGWGAMLLIDTTRERVDDRYPWSLMLTTLPVPTSAEARALAAAVRSEFADRGLPADDIAGGATQTLFHQLVETPDDRDAIKRLSSDAFFLNVARLEEESEYYDAMLEHDLIPVFVAVKGPVCTGHMLTDFGPAAPDWVFEDVA